MKRMPMLIGGSAALRCRTLIVLCVCLSLPLVVVAREIRDTDAPWGNVQVLPTNAKAPWPVDARLMLEPTMDAVNAERLANSRSLTNPQALKDSAASTDFETSTTHNATHASSDSSGNAMERGAAADWSKWVQPDQLSGTVRLALGMTVLSLAPAILLMTTSYIRIVVVLSILKQALGLQNVASNQIVTAATLFLTCLIMWPVWNEVHTQAIVPYTQGDGTFTLEDAWRVGVRPVHRFMSHQIDQAQNHADVLLFLDYLDSQTPETVEYAYVTDYEQVPLQALLPAFLLSELKTAFLIGFQLYLPFVVLDLVVASLTVSMGMFMVPPATLATPLKLMLFVLVDGWHLIVEMLLASFQS